MIRSSGRRPAPGKPPGSGRKSPKQVEDSIWHHAESGWGPDSCGPGTKACGEGEAALTPPSTAVLLLHLNTQDRFGVGKS